MKKLLKKYGFFAVMLGINLFTLALFPQTGIRSFGFAIDSVFGFLINLTPVFICIGLMDVWIEKETMYRLMGENSGPRGTLLSFLMGMVTAVPMYALLPVAGLLLKKNCRIFNVLIFVCASAGMRIPLLLFEMSSLGIAFTAVRFLTNIVSVLAAAYFVNRALSEKEKTGIYENAEKL